MHGTSSANGVEPVNDGTSDSTRAHWSARVVVAQRSGGPNSSTSRARSASAWTRSAGSIWTCVVSATA